METFFYQNSKLYLESYFSEVNAIWLDIKHNSAVGGGSERKGPFGGNVTPLPHPMLTRAVASWGGGWGAAERLDFAQHLC